MLNSFCRCFYFWSTNDGEPIDNHTFGQVDAPDVSLDFTKCGQDVVIVKNGRRLCGSGGALANMPIAQNKAYFEVKIQAKGKWGIGLATNKVNLDKIPLGSDTESWVLRDSGSVFFNNAAKFNTDRLIDEGDVIGVTYDHELLNFYLNGDDLETCITGIRGSVFPVIYVDEGAILDIYFTGFFHQPPIGFGQIMQEKSIL